MNKKVLIILSLVAVGNEAWAMESSAAAAASESDRSSSRSSSPRSIESSSDSSPLPIPQGWSGIFGSFGAITFGRVGGVLDGASAAASNGLHAATSAVDHEVVQPVRELTDPTKNGKQRGWIASACRRGQEIWNPAVLRAKVGLTPLPTDPNYADYKQFADETIRFQEEIDRQFRQLHKPMASDPSQTLLGDNQLRKLVKRQYLTTQYGNEIFTALQRFRNGPDREKRDALRQAALDLRASKQLTDANRDIIAPLVALALAQQRSEVRPMIQRSMLGQNRELARILTQDGYERGYLYGYDSADEEGNYQADVEKLMTSHSHSSSEEIAPADDSRDSKDEQ